MWKMTETLELKNFKFHIWETFSIQYLNRILKGFTKNCQAKGLKSLFQNFRSSK